MATATIVQSPATAPASKAPAALPFTLSTLRASLPASVFAINTPLSILYFFRDYFFIAVCYAVQPYVFEFGIVASLLWINVVGFLFWCLFVVGHDCGHGTFSTNANVNFIFGLLSHSPIMVPFSGWQKSHFLHHTHHNHVENDHSWRPIPFTEYKDFLACKEKTLLGAVQYFMRFSYGMFVLYPVYLLTEHSELSSGNHFNPMSRLFETTTERVKSAISTAGVLLSLGLTIYFSPSWSWFVVCYFLPYLVFCAWLDMVTYLHHTSTVSTYYRDGEWSFLKGGLSTIDRSYGSLLDHLHHNIGTHMVHHLFFTSIPHYNLLAANESLKKALGSYYKYDETPFYIAMLNMMRECKYVDDDGKVLKYKNDADYSRELKSKSS